MPDWPRQNAHRLDGSEMETGLAVKQSRIGGDKMRTGTELDFSRDEVQQLEELMGRNKFFSHVVATYRLTVEVSGSIMLLLALIGFHLHRNIYSNCYIYM